MPRKLLDKGVCWKGNWPCPSDRCPPCLAYVTGAARTEGAHALFLAPWQLTDFRVSRDFAWDSSLSANASKVLSTRALLPIAPRRHSAASTLSNSGGYIPHLAITALGWRLMRKGDVANRHGDHAIAVLEG